MGAPHHIFEACDPSALQCLSVLSASGNGQLHGLSLSGEGVGVVRIVRRRARGGSWSRRVWNHCWISTEVRGAASRPVDRQAAVRSVVFFFHREPGEVGSAGW